MQVPVTVVLWDEVEAGMTFEEPVLVGTFIGGAKYGVAVEAGGTYGVGGFLRAFFCFGSVAMFKVTSLPVACPAGAQLTYSPSLVRLLRTISI